MFLKTEVGEPALIIGVKRRRQRFILGNFMIPSVGPTRHASCKTFRVRKTILRVLSSLEIRFLIIFERQNVESFKI